MTQEADIYIRTRILQQGAEDVVELSTAAVVSDKNNSCFIMYEETDEESGAVTKCRIRLDHDRMEITRKGQINSLMEFVQGKDTVTDYRTPYGLLRMDIHTDSLAIARTSECIEVRAVYVLSADGEPISRNELMLRVQVCGIRDRQN